MDIPAITREELARGYRELYGEAFAWKVRQGRAERAGRGLPNYNPPLGYRLVGQGREQRVEIDEAKAPFVREAFRLAAEGLSLRRILARLTARGMRTARGKEMSPIALAKILRNRFYLGEVYHRSAWLPGEQEPLVSKTLFSTVQRRLMEG